MKLLFVSLLSCFGTIPQAIAKPPDLKPRFEKEIRQSRVKPEELGVFVSYFSNGEIETIYSLNAEKSMVPASITKIITAAATLDLLGPGHKMGTELLSEAPIEKGRLKGSVYLKGGGDPGFVSESMWFLVNEFTRNDIKAIEGDVIVDDTRFDQVRNDESRSDERVDRAYDAPVGAMSFNWNSVNIYVRPSEAGKAARVFLDPENSYLKLINLATTGKSGSRSSISVQRRHGLGQDEIRVSGKIPQDKSEQVIFKNISEPDLWSGHNLVSFLKQRGIGFTGRVVRGAVPSNAKVLARAESKPLSQLVADMMKFSNNFVAEMLTKNLAAEKIGTPAKMNQGMGLLQKFVVDIGIDPKNFVLVNPSGLTRENRFRAVDLHEFMVKMERKFSSFAENLSSYPLAGVDGTLKSRMKGTSAEGRVRAKTGRLTGVDSLAGYAGRADGSLFTFVFMFNGRADHGEDARLLFDRLAARMVE